MTDPTPQRPEPGAAPALRMEGVRKVYPTGGDEVVALDHVNLTLASDEILALLGPSGSGKTTLCSIAGALLSPTEGTVEVGGQNIVGFSGKELTRFRRESVGFVFQTVNLVPFLTARENLLVSTSSAGATVARRASAPTSCSRSSSSPRRQTCSRRSSPVGRSSAWPSAGP